ncbi:LPXTG cell wall anchor domain-containing protein [Haladaptatus sp. ZSTT2]
MTPAAEDGGINPLFIGLIALLLVAGLVSVYWRRRDDEQ